MDKLTTCNRYLISSTPYLNSHHRDLIAQIGCDTITSPFCYSGETRSKILQAKLYGRKKAALEVIDQAIFLMEEWLTEQDWDFIIPIPPDTRRTARRGFHIPDLFAQALSRRARKTRLSFHERTLLKWRTKFYRTSQTEVLPEKREENVANQIIMRRKFKNRPNPSLLIVDDVIATGATMKAAIQCIEKHNPARIDILALTHTHDR